MRFKQVFYPSGILDLREEDMIYSVFIFVLGKCYEIKKKDTKKKTVNLLDEIFYLENRTVKHDREVVEVTEEIKLSYGVKAGKNV